MNRENMQQAINWVRDDGVKIGRKKLGFNMSSWLSTGNPDRRGTCGTTACIAGTVYCALNPPRKGVSQFDYLDIVGFDSHRFARDYLGLTGGQAIALFYADELSLRLLDQITHEQAARVMEAMLASTDPEPMPDWNAVIGDQP